MIQVLERFHRILLCFAGQPDRPRALGELAERVGISRQHLGAIEAPNLVRPISLELLFNIADVLDIPAYKLLRFRDEE